MNQRTGDVLATALELAADSRSRRQGLLGRAALPAAAALVLAPCAAIHTCFMRFPIDVLFVRADGTVVRVDGAVRPWRIRLAPTAFAVIEFHAGSVAKRVRPGDSLAVA